jgi:hypothetical protein
MEVEFNLPVNIGNPVEFTIMDFGRLVLRLSETQAESYRPLPVDDPNPEAGHQRGESDPRLGASVDSKMVWRGQLSGIATESVRLGAMAFSFQYAIWLTSIRLMGYKIGVSVPKVVYRMS